LRCQL
jgi:hypothetical protein